MKRQTRRRARPRIWSSVDVDVCSRVVTLISRRHSIQDLQRALTNMGFNFSRFPPGHALHTTSVRMASADDLELLFLAVPEWSHLIHISAECPRPAPPPSCPACPQTCKLTPPSCPACPLPSNSNAELNSIDRILQSLMALPRP